MTDKKKDDKPPDDLTEYWAYADFSPKTEAHWKRVVKTGAAAADRAFERVKKAKGKKD